MKTRNAVIIGATVVIILLIIGIAIAYSLMASTGSSTTNSQASTTSTAGVIFQSSSSSIFQTSSLLSSSSSPSFSESTTSTSISSIIHASTTGTSTFSSNSSMWLTYHNDLSRDGYAPNGLSQSSSFRSAHIDWKSPTLDGSIYAEPLIANHAVFVATENNSMYALNESNGRVLWHKNLGTPIPLSSLPCGNIDPAGITGTPVIDPIRGTIYAVGFLQPGKHVLFALSIINGSVLWSRTIDPSGMNVMVQQQRAALALANGFVYVAFGGLYGDCGTYEGWVVGVPEDISGSMITYEVPANGAGIWAPSGPAVDIKTGELYVATGNSGSGKNFDFSESVIALSPALKELDYFAPTNWASLNSGDVDLGSVGPTMLGNGIIFQVGKEGIGYLLSMNHLGGIGGQLFSAQVCNSEAVGGAAYASQYLYVPCTSGLVALKVNLNSPSFSEIWNSSQSFTSPPIIADGAVWNVDVNRGMLFAFNPYNSTALFSYEVGSTVHFTTPSAADSWVFVAASSSIEAFLVSN